eukprot:3167480-Amphidinium_carterae.2
MGGTDDTVDRNLASRQRGFGVLLPSIAALSSRGQCWDQSSFIGVEEWACASDCSMRSASSDTSSPKKSIRLQLHPPTQTPGRVGFRFAEEDDTTLVHSNTQKQQNRLAAESLSNSWLKDIVVATPPSQRNQQVCDNSVAEAKDALQ